MKKNSVGLLLLLMLSLNALWVEIPENSTYELFESNSENLASTQISFSLDGYDLQETIESGETFHKISYFNEGRFIEVGKPDLPRFSRLIAIPNEGNVSYEVISLEKEIINNINVYPTQHLKSESQPNRTDFAIDNKFYTSDNIFPQNIIEVQDPAIMRDYRVVNFTINPFQFNSATGELSVIKSIELIVTTSGKGGINTKTGNKRISKYFEPLYESTIINYERSRDEYQQPCILYVYPNNANLLSTLEILTEWKQQKGFEVALVSTSETGTSNYSIKNYIQNAYNTWENPPEFVTLVGDANSSYSVTTYYETWSGYGGEGDHPYSQLEGNDILADVIMGRLSISNITELQTIVSKVLNYEKIPFMGNTGWYDRALMVGDPSSSGPSCIFTKQYITELIDVYAPNISTTEVYSGNYFNQMISNTNSGISYFNYRGYYGMSGIGSSSISSLSNGLMMPFAVFLTCDTGSFSSDAVCRSEAFLRAGTPGNPNGAIAAVGTATTGTHTAFNNCIDAGIYQGVFAGEIYNPGGALVRGKLHLYTSFPNNPSNKVNIFSHWNTMMGDPSVELWTCVPKVLVAEYDIEISSTSNYLEVTVEDDTGLPIEDAWVTAFSESNDIYASGYSNAEGKVFLAMEVENSDSFSLTVTKHNFIPHLGEVNVVTQNLALNVNSIDIDDDNSGTSSGNNDGLINPGESIELNIELINGGSSAANNVTATIESINNNVVIISGNGNYGNIQSGQTAFSDFAISINEDVLGGSEVHLSMTIEDGAGNTWQENIFLEIHGINLYVTDYEIENEPNGIFDPGETVEMVVTLYNTGTIDAENIEAILSCNNPNITIEDSLGTFATIFADNETDNDSDRFEVTASYDIIPGSQIQFSLELTNPDNFSNVVLFMVEVGAVTVNDPLGPDSYGYYCYDSGDSSYDLAPSYNWIEIDPDNGGDGTILNLNDNGDTGDTEDVDVPFSFNFYGIPYDMLSVCSNGWVAPGGSSQSSFMNSQIPGPQGPSPMIAPFWDDLKTSSGNVCYLYDDGLHVFIVEWSELNSDYNNSEETFQLILYDPAFYPTASGDAEIVFQYKEVSNSSHGNYSGYGVEHGQYASVGLEDHTFLNGLEYTYNNSYPTAALPLEDEMALKFTTSGSTIVDPPIVTFNQTEFNFYLQQGASGTQTLEISNIGQANLVYSIIKDYVDDSSRNGGGPDDYGYCWEDSDEANGPEYSWRDISGIATEVTFNHNDIGTALMPIGFDFNFYGTTYTEFRINPNGWFGFGADNEEWQNTSLPHSDAPKPAIMPYWDDLDPVSDGNVYYYSSSDSLVIWFDDVIHYQGNYNGTYDFQAIIYTNGEILLQYREMTGDIDAATIGLQNEDNSIGLEIVFDNNLVSDEYAIYIKKIIDWVEIEPDYGFVEAGDMALVSLDVSAEELDFGVFECDLLITTNDPEANYVTIPIILNVTSDIPILVTSSDEIDFGEVVINEELIDTLLITNFGSVVLEVSDIIIDSDNFSVYPTNFDLETNESEEIYITFLPTEEIQYEENLIIYSNDPNNPEYEVQLLGSGYLPTGSGTELPLVTEVNQNYPNPFNPETTISFSISEPNGEAVKLEIYNIRGQLIKSIINERMDAGYHNVIWNGENNIGQKVASGIYFYKFKAGDYQKIRKMLLIK